MTQAVIPAQAGIQSGPGLRRGYDRPCSVSSD